jgi:chromate reductase, NAD(P)H dehydrogenase (quinone)
MIKVLGIPSCIHKQASSLQLLHHIKSVGGRDWVLDIADLSNLPLFNRDLHNSLSFQKSNVEYFRNLVDESHAVIFCASEFPLGYAYSVSAPIKNAIDWAVIEPNLLENKAAAFLGKNFSFFTLIRLSFSG